MNNTLYTIYWLVDNEPQHEQTSDLGYALARAENLRKANWCSAVTFCSENMDSVGKPGVDSVKDGKTPDGIEYSWVKRRDGGQ